MNNQNKKTPIAFALCGSFCSFEAIFPEIEYLKNNWDILPIMSFDAACCDTRFGKANEWKRKFSETVKHPVRESLQDVEPLGPKHLADAMIVAPCTGVTLAKLALGLSDTPVTLAVKSLLRNGKPIILAISTNDGLGTSLAHIATLLQRKNIFFVPFNQDDCEQKPMSLKANFSLLEDTLKKALNKEQIQPIISK